MPGKKERKTRRSASFCSCEKLVSGPFLLTDTLGFCSFPCLQVVWLSVFHELHCVNILRKLVWYEYYDVHADLLAGRNNMRNHLSTCRPLPHPPPSIP